MQSTPSQPKNGLPQALEIVFQGLGVRLCAALGDLRVFQLSTQAVEFGLQRLVFVLEGLYTRTCVS